MPLMMVRYHVSEEGVPKVIAAVEAAVAALKAQNPKGVHYAYARRAGGTEFVAVLALDEGAENPLLAIPAARELQATVAKFVTGEPPMPQPFDLIASYGFAP